MNKKVAFIFPGQGAQYPGMGRDFYEKYPTAKVIDIEGASSSVEVDVQVVQDPRVDPSDLGQGELLERILDSYPLARIGDLLR